MIVYPISMRSRCNDDLVELFSAEGITQQQATNGCTSTDENFTQTANLTELPDAIDDWWKWMPVAGGGPSSVTQIPALAMFNKNSMPTNAPASPTLPREMSGYRYDDISEALHDLDCHFEIERTNLGTAGSRDLRVFLMSGAAPGFKGDGCGHIGLPGAFRANTSGRTLAHEASHTLGLVHSSNAHGEADGGGERTRWPDDHGELGPPRNEGWGFDVGAMTPIPPTTRGAHVHDFMSYGKGMRWVAVDTWLAPFEAMRTNRTVSDERSGAWPDPGPDEGGEVGRAISSTWRAELPADLAVVALEVRSGQDVLVEVASTGEPIAPALVVGSEGGAVVVDAARQPGVAYGYGASRDGETWSEFGANDGGSFTVAPGDSGLAGTGWRVRVEASDGVQLVTDEVGGVDFGTPAPIAEILALGDGDSVDDRYDDDVELLGSSDPTDPSSIPFAIFESDQPLLAAEETGGSWRTVAIIAVVMVALAAMVIIGSRRWSKTRRSAIPAD